MRKIFCLIVPILAFVVSCAATPKNQTANSRKIASAEETLDASELDAHPVIKFDVDKINRELREHGNMGATEFRNDNVRFFTVRNVRLLNREGFCVHYLITIAASGRKGRHEGVTYAKLCGNEVELNERHIITLAQSISSTYPGMYLCSYDIPPNNYPGGYGFITRVDPSTLPRGQRPTMTNIKQLAVAPLLLQINNATTHYSNIRGESARFAERSAQDLSLHSQSLNMDLMDCRLQP